MDNQINAEVDTRFSREVKKIRAEYMERRDKTNLGNYLDMEHECGQKQKAAVVYWLDNGTGQGQTVRLFDIPGTLSGDILRLRANLPQRSDHYEIDGDEIHPLDAGLPLPEPDEDDSEDTDDLLASLPLVEVDRERHFVKKGKYRSEIVNLLKCQYGSCPGPPTTSKHIVQLLGKSAKGELVFDKFFPRQTVLTRFSDLATFKRWLLHLVDALESLHSANIVHRDLRVENFVFSRDGERLVVADLEEHWGQRGAPEIAKDGPPGRAGWTTMSDVYQIAQCIRCMVLGDVPRTSQYPVPIPKPLDAIADACSRTVPELRPTVPQLRRMLEAIDPVADAE
ncbi:kinase-like domain-containing protein [Nemania diffusa]|nr:kinase-like domain-containing protein [Nemania diffusa]